MWCNNIASEGKKFKVTVTGMNDFPTETNGKVILMAIYKSVKRGN